MVKYVLGFSDITSIKLIVILHYLPVTVRGIQLYIFSVFLEQNSQRPKSYIGLTSGIRTATFCRRNGQQRIARVTKSIDILPPLHSVVVIVILSARQLYWTFFILFAKSKLTALYSLSLFVRDKSKIGMKIYSKAVFSKVNIQEWVTLMPKIIISTGIYL